MADNLAGFLKCGTQESWKKFGEIKSGTQECWKRVNGARLATHAIRFLIP
jgi:hypothetical protein